MNIFSKERTSDGLQKNDYDFLFQLFGEPKEQASVMPGVVSVNAEDQKCRCVPYYLCLSTFVIFQISGKKFWNQYFSINRLYCTNDGPLGWRFKSTIPLCSNGLLYISRG